MTTNARTEARAIALPATGPFVSRLIRIFSQHPNDDTSAIVLIEYAQAAVATALAAKDAEMAAEKRKSVMLEKSAGFATDDVARLEYENKALRAQLAEANKALEQVKYEAFTHGYVVACCNISNAHNEEAIACDILAELGATRKEVRAIGLDEYDLKALKKIEKARGGSPYRKTAREQGGK